MAVVAIFFAEHVNSPKCLSVTESIVSTEFRLPIWAVVTPAISPTGFALKYQRNSMGKSPDVTKHCTLAESPKFDGSSPKLNGATFGGTVLVTKKKKQYVVVVDVFS